MTHLDEEIEEFVACLERWDVLTTWELKLSVLFDQEKGYEFARKEELIQRLARQLWAQFSLVLPPTAVPATESDVRVITAFSKAILVQFLREMVADFVGIGIVKALRSEFDAIYLVNRDSRLSIVEALLELDKMLEHEQNLRAGESGDQAVDGGTNEKKSEERQTVGHRLSWNREWDKLKSLANRLQAMGLIDDSSQLVSFLDEKTDYQGKVICNWDKRGALGLVLVLLKTAEFIRLNDGNSMWKRVTLQFEKSRIGGRDSRTWSRAVSDFRSDKEGVTGLVRQLGPTLRSIGVTDEKVKHSLGPEAALAYAQLQT